MGDDDSVLSRFNLLGADNSSSNQLYDAWKSNPVFNKQYTRVANPGLSEYSLIGNKPTSVLLGNNTSTLRGFQPTAGTVALDTPVTQGPLALQANGENSIFGQIGDWLNGVTDIFKNGDGTWNLQGMGNFLGGAGQLGSAVLNGIMGMKAYNLAKDQYGFQKALAQRNLANSVEAYNTRLGDMYRARGITESGDEHKFDKQFEDNKLSATL